MWSKSSSITEVNTKSTNKITQGKCLLDIISMSQFSHQSKQELCDNTEFIKAIGACLRENCNTAETQGRETHGDFRRPTR
jgi:hypothetical protein